jgi:hypothetical protein
MEDERLANIQLRSGEGYAGVAKREGSRAVTASAMSSSFA